MSELIPAISERSPLYEIHDTNRMQIVTEILSMRTHSNSDGDSRNWLLQSGFACNAARILSPICCQAYNKPLVDNIYKSKNMSCG